MNNKNTVEKSLIPIKSIIITSILSLLSLITGLFKIDSSTIEIKIIFTLSIFTIFLVIIVIIMLFAFMETKYQIMYINNTSSFLEDRYNTLKLDSDTLKHECDNLEKKITNIEKNL